MPSPTGERVPVISLPDLIAMKQAVGRDLYHQVIAELRRRHPLPPPTLANPLDNPSRMRPSPGLDSGR
ncbi:hypothetical protein BH24ACT5_BH24ACT5_20340 [soil metagenome]